MSSTIKLTRRRVLASLLVISLAAAAAGAGTMAYFSDTEASTGNTVAAGTLDLKVNGGDSDVELINVSDAAPGDSGSGSLTLNNSGSIDGSLDFNVTVTNFENGNGEAEPDDADDGELGENLEVKVYVAGGQNVTSGWVNANTLDGDWDQNLQLDAGSSKELVVEWRIPTTVGNEIQSDSIIVDVTFELNQNDGQ